MRAVVQRVSQAAVTVGDRTVGTIDRGLLVFIGVEQGDGPEDVHYIAGKIRDLRVFEDPAEPSRHMNRSVQDVGGAVLVVSQFTLYGDAAKGKRPSFIDAARPEQAVPLYDGFVGMLRVRMPRVETGEFGAHMDVSLVNDGPVTLWLER